MTDETELAEILERLEERVEAIGDELGIDYSEDEHEYYRWYRIGNRHFAPVVETDIHAAPPEDRGDTHDFASKGVAVYTDEPLDSSNWWEVTENSSSHETDREYGYWFSLGTTIDTATSEEVFE